MVLIPIEQYERLLKRKHTEAQSGAEKSARAEPPPPPPPGIPAKRKTDKWIQLKFWYKTMSKTKYLQKIYFDSSHPAAYSSEEKLYRWVKEEGKYKIPRAEIKKWLQSQEAYSVHKQSRGKFARRSVIATYKHYQWDIDTAVLESYKSENDGYAYFVLAIDIFSRFVWTFPLKTRKGTEMAKALSEIFKTAGQTPPQYSDR